MPSVLLQPKDGTHWGGVIGRSAGEAYAIRLAKKRINNAKCNERVNGSKGIPMY